MIIFGMAAIAAAITIVVYVALGGAPVKSQANQVATQSPAHSAMPIPRSGVDPLAPLPRSTGGSRA